MTKFEFSRNSPQFINRNLENSQQKSQSRFVANPSKHRFNPPNSQGQSISNAASSSFSRPRLEQHPEVLLNKLSPEQKQLFQDQFNKLRLPIWFPFKKNTPTGLGTLLYRLFAVGFWVFLSLFNPIRSLGLPALLRHPPQSHCMDQYQVWNIENVFNCTYNLALIPNKCGKLLIEIQKWKEFIKKSLHISQ